jgi:uncharacterized damage-inducible protein DinB
VSVSYRIDELLDYSDHERGKWREWLAADPSRLSLPLQPGGRFPTVGSLLDHTFLVERRHLSRLEGGTPPDSSGLATRDVTALFDYADLVRADLRRYVADLDDTEAQERLTFTVQTGGTVTMTRRKLVMHILMHEVRHLAQVALAARLAGHEPPGQHDFFYYPD